MALELRDVRKGYGAVTALDGVSLTVEPGAVHCLAGPNGSGKTTLLRVALGLTRPTAGRVSLSGGTLGAVFQTPSLFDDLTVAENLAAFAGMAGGADPGHRRRVVERLGLTDVRDRVAGELSTGFRKRLDLAAGLVTGHEYLLCDEPLADVDDATRGRVVELLGALDGAVLVATHDLDAFAGDCDRLTVLSGGRVILDVDAAEFDGPPRARYARALGRGRD